MVNIMSIQITVQKECLPKMTNYLLELSLSGFLALVRASKATISCPHSPLPSSKRSICAYKINYVMFLLELNLNKLSFVRFSAAGLQKINRYIGR